MKSSLAQPTLATWFVFPILLVAATSTSLHLLSRGLPPPLVSLALMLALVATILLLERLFPQHAAWNARPDPTDVLLLLVNRGVDALVIASSLTLAAHLPAAAHLWPTHAPLLLQAILGVIIGEAIRYAVHRLSHHPGLLWRIHRTHHQPQRMYALNGPRLHPANSLWVAMAHATPMLLLGAPLAAVALAANLTVFFVLFQHANVRLRFDGLNQLLATPDVHRLHHARAAVDGVNYGIVILLFDRLFGTSRPAGPPPAADDIGLGDAPAARAA